MLGKIANFLSFIEFILIVFSAILDVIFTKLVAVYYGMFWTHTYP